MGDHLELPTAVSINFSPMDIDSRVTSYVERTEHIHRPSSVILHWTDRTHT